MTHRLTTNYAKNYCNRTLIVKVIVENVVTCFWGTRCITFKPATKYTQHVHRTFAAAVRRTWRDLSPAQRPHIRK